jgi:hypothetical protein
MAAGSASHQRPIRLQAKRVSLGSIRFHPVRPGHLGGVLEVASWRVEFVVHEDAELVEDVFHGDERSVESVPALATVLPIA